MVCLRVASSHCHAVAGVSPPHPLPLPPPPHPPTRRLGPRGFLVRRLTPARLAAAIRDGMVHLDEYTRNTEGMAYELQQEAGVELAADIIERACVA